MITIACALFAILIVGAGWSYDHLRASQRHADDLAIIDARTIALAAARDTYAAQRVELATERSMRRRAKVDAEWAKAMLFVAEARADLHADRHVCLVGIEGMRAETEEGVTYPGAEPPMSVAVREGAEVVELRGRR